MGLIDNLIEMIIGLFVLVILGYVFATVLWTISPIMSILFILALLIVAYGILTRTKGD